MSKLIKVGIIGAGKIAREHLKAIKYIKNFSVSGITSRTHQKAFKLAKEFKIKNVFI